MMAIEVAFLASYEPSSLCGSSANRQTIVQSQSTSFQKAVTLTYFSDFSLTARLEVNWLGPWRCLTARSYNSWDHGYIHDFDFEKLHLLGPWKCLLDLKLH